MGPLSCLTCRYGVAARSTMLKLVGCSSCKCYRGFPSWLGVDCWLLVDMHGAVPVGCAETWFFGHALHVPMA